jgi:hypothetical protein
MDTRARFDQLLPKLQQFIGKPMQAKIPFSGRSVVKAIFVFNWFNDTEGEHADEVSDLLGDVTDEEEMKDYVHEGSLIEGVIPIAYVFHDGAFDDGLERGQCEGLLVVDLRKDDGPVLLAEVDGTIIPDQGFDRVAASLAGFNLEPYDKDMVGHAELLPGSEDDEGDGDE